MEVDLAFIDDSVELNQGDVVVRVPRQFRESLDNLTKALRQETKIACVYRGNMGAFFHVRVRLHDDKKSKALLGWKKGKDNDEHVKEIEKTIYLNRPTLHKLNLVSDEDHGTLVDFLKNGHLPGGDLKEDRWHSHLDTHDLDLQIQLINYLAESL